MINRHNYHVLPGMVVYVKMPTNRQVHFVGSDGRPMVVNPHVELVLVSHTYCLPHTRQVIRYTTFLDLQLSFSNILYSCFVFGALE